MLTEAGVGNSIALDARFTVSASNGRIEDERQYAMGHDQPADHTVGDPTSETWKVMPITKEK